jgi:uncharacterized DUF497 family protein
VTIRVEGFDWDEGNKLKCQKHGLTLDEIEEFFCGKVFVAPDIKHSQDEERFLAVGRSRSGKPMFVAFALRNNSIRPISARYMHDREARQYEEISTENGE